MADNITIKDGSGSNVTMATDDLSGVNYPRHKMTWGADGVANDVSAANPVPTNPNTTRGSGAVDSNTQRVTLATDGPGVANLGTIATNTGNIPAADNSKTPVIPSMTSGGNVSVQTAATGTNWTAFGSQALKQLTVSNQTGVAIEFRQGGAGVGFQVPTGAFYTFFGITNANQLEARRVDTGNTQVTVTARWES